MRSPVLLIVFNRPETTARVFEAVRQARPSRLYIAADGPRAHRAGEQERCAEVRKIVSNVDWAADVRTLFRDKNLGCKQGVSEAITWFFQHEPEGIILEDDVLPQSSFFFYCDELLERYRDDHRVAMVSGCNFIEPWNRVSTSYYFSVMNHIWGWAAWRRSWEGYDATMSDWPVWKKSPALKDWLGGSRYAAAYWQDQFDRVHQGAIDTWDLQWTYHCWRNRLVTALPAHSLIDNLGFGPGATHTTKSAPAYVREMKTRELAWPLLHPNQVAVDEKSEALLQKRIFGVTPLRYFRKKLQALGKRILFLG